MISAASVAEIFRKSGVAAVAIIDDDFDRADQSMPASLASVIFSAIIGDVNLTGAFADAGHPLESADDLTTKAIGAIKARVGVDPHAREAWDRIQAANDTRGTALVGFARDLGSELKVKVRKIAAAAFKDGGGAGLKKIIDHPVDIVFLDYELKEGENEGLASAEITASIHAHFASSQKAPLVILMSTRDLREEDVAAFQRRTKVLSGMFYFVPKKELFDKEKRHYRLAAFARSMSTGQVLRRFVSSLERSLDEARARVFADVRSLAIGDHAFLQKLRLHEDGQPLGEYLLWLVNAHLTKELLGSGDIRAREAEVNALTFDHLPPTQAKPSINLATLYSSAVMRPMDPLPATPTDQATYLQFGDLFRQDKSKRVWLCITAPCDLAFSQTRPIRSKRSILFLPGSLQPIEQGMKPFEQRQPRTELVRIDGKAYRILWEVKEVARADWSGVHAWKTTQRAERIARLNTAFALEIQRSFATDLTRVGMPVPPPFYNAVRVRLVVLDAEDRELELTGPARCDGYLSGDERNTHLVLGDGFMNGLPEMLKIGEETLELRSKRVEERRKSHKADPGAVANARAARDRIAAARRDALILSGLKGPFSVPGSDGIEMVLDELLAISGHGDLVKVGSHVPLRLTVLPIDDAAGETPA